MKSPILPVQLASQHSQEPSAGEAAFAGDPPFAQKKRSSHSHTCIQAVVKFCPSLASSGLCCPECFHARMNWHGLMKIMRIPVLEQHETHRPTAVPCTLLQSGVFEPVPHDLPDKLGILWCTYLSDLPPQQSHAM